MAKKIPGKQADLFGEVIRVEHTQPVAPLPNKNNEYKKIKIIIKGEPISKQSVRATVRRYFQNGTHWCPYCKDHSNHSKGDVVVFEKHGIVNAILDMHPDSKKKKIIDANRLQVNQYLKINYPGFEPFIGDVHLESCTFIFQHPKSFSNKKIELMKEGTIYYKNTKPDLDNLFKPLFDTLNGIAYEDDARIVTMGKIVKRWGLIPGIILELKID